MRREPHGSDEAPYRRWPAGGREGGKKIVMRVPADGGGRLVVELTPEEAAELGAALSSVGE